MKVFNARYRDTNTNATFGMLFGERSQAVEFLAKLRRGIALDIVEDETDDPDVIEALRKFTAVFGVA